MRLYNILDFYQFHNEINYLIKNDEVTIWWDEPAGALLDG